MQTLRKILGALFLQGCHTCWAEQSRKGKITQLMAGHPVQSSWMCKPADSSVAEDAGKVVEKRGLQLYPAGRRLQFRLIMNP